ncbi:unnamed protein product [Prunus armeniaca]
MFKQTLDVLLQVLVVFPNVETLRSKVTSFVHRMVDTLGASVFPYLLKALEQLLVDSERFDGEGRDVGTCHWFSCFFFILKFGF